jgi:hypothetical protein
MATPSLAMIPSGYKASKVYSVLPESGVGDFDFARTTTATRVNSSGLIETVAINVPRLEYPLIDGVVNGCPSLLIEPQSTNLITYSSELTNSSWVKTNSGTGSAPIITSNYSISPDGTQNADRVIFNLNGGTANGDISQVSVTLGGVSSASYTNSVYIKSNTANDYDLVVTDPSGGHITKNISTQWQRFDNSRENVTNLSIRIRLRGDESTSDYADVSIWGAQIEEQSYATSLIKTSGSAVTRNGETCTGAGDAATFNDSRGVLMAEISALVDDQTRRQISVSDGTTDNVVRLHYNDSGSNIIRFQIRTNGAIQVSKEFSVNDIKEFHKVAIFYRLNDVKFFIDGIEVGTDTTAVMPSGLSVLEFNQGNGAFPFYGKTKQLQYFDSALTDSELEKLTSWTSFTDMANGQQYSII